MPKTEPFTILLVPLQILQRAGRGVGQNVVASANSAMHRHSGKQSANHVSLLKLRQFLKFMGRTIDAGIFVLGNRVPQQAAVCL